MAKLPVWETTGAIFKSFFHWRWLVFFGEVGVMVAVVGALLSVGIRASGFRSDSDGLVVLFIIVFALAMWVLISALAVAVHRTVLLDERPYHPLYLFRLLPWAGQYMMAVIGFGFIMAGLGLILFALMAPLYFLMGAFGDGATPLDDGSTPAGGVGQVVLTLVLGGLGLGALVAYVYWAIRLSLVFPAVAVKGMDAWGDAIDLTKDNVLRLFAVSLAGSMAVGVPLAVVVILVGGILTTIFPDGMAEVYLAMIDGQAEVTGIAKWTAYIGNIAYQLVIWLGGVLVLTECYRALASQNPAEPPVETKAETPDTGGPTSGASA